MKKYPLKFPFPMPSQNQSGLSHNEAAKRLEQYGPNILPQQKAEPWWQKLLHEFADIMVLILIAAALIAFFLGEKVDGSIILGIVILNACIGFFQEWKSEKTLEALQKMVSPEATVIRAGKEQSISADLLVPGDTVQLREGDRIPADGKILESFDLKAEESALTGESQPVEKAIGQEVYLGTAVVYGSAIMEITATGGKTKFGNIARLTLSTTTEKSPLQKELLQVGIFIGKLTGILVVLIFAIDFFLKETAFVESLLFSISVAVAAVPEGLPATITIALALGVQRLAKKNAIVKKLSSAETLGATTVICSDKTGTITRNEMTVTKAFLPSGETASFSGIGWQPEGAITFQSDEESSQDTLKKLLQIAALCNDARLVTEKSVVKILGDPTEGALLVAARKFENSLKTKISTGEIRKKFPFESSRKMMSVLVALEGKNMLLSKGAPEMLLEKCTSYWNGTKAEKMTAAKKQEFLKQMQQMSRQALRVLGFARRELGAKEMPASAAEAEQDLTFYGLLGMIDPPRQAVPDAVKAAHAAGVRVIMITGDNPETAEAIAREVGILRHEDSLVLTGAELQVMSDAELQKALFKKPKNRAEINAKYTDILFARTAPEDKMRIVSLLQQKGEVVAVTGDGVNDAPALKKANIGVTMGITGTEVSKEAASMILLDDSFATIVTAIREGRKIFENIRKFLWFLFAGNIGEIIVIMTTLILAVPAPLTAVLILFVNLGTDVLPAIALSFEKAEPEIMKMPPRDPNAHILRKSFVMHFVLRGVLLAATVLGVYFWTLFAGGWNWGESISAALHAEGRSVAFSALVMSQLFAALCARNFYHSAFHKFFENKILLIAIATSLSIVGIILFVPMANELLETTALSWTQLLTVFIASSGILWVEELRKIFQKNLTENN